MAFQRGFTCPALLLILSVFAFLNAIASSNFQVDGTFDAGKNPKNCVERVMSEISQLKKEQKELKNKYEQLENKNQEQDNEIEFLKAKNDEQEEMYRKSREEVRHLNLKLEQLIKKKSLTEKSLNNNAVDLIPSNCNDLKQIGHSLNGFYPVKNPRAANGSNQTMMLIFCNFHALPDKIAEKPIGSIDIQSFSNGVYFNVKKNSSFAKINKIIPFEVEVLNIGRAMDLNAGKFTAPANGVYHFAFKAVAHGKFVEPPSTVYVRLRLNGKDDAQAYASTSDVEQDKYAFTLALHSILKLKKGDVIQLVLIAGAMYDDYTSNTQFIGFLLREY